MTEQRLSRLESVPWRGWTGEWAEVWKNEDAFTRWLLREENLKLLGDALVMELESPQREVEAGKGRADIIAINAYDDNSEVVIENQITKSDYGHLGQLLTYTAARSALSAIWIAPEFVPEHLDVLEWLNKMLNDKGVRFFAVEIELYRIGDSPLAPSFSPMAMPSDWKEPEQEEPSPKTAQTRERQFAFWNAFHIYASEKAPTIKLGKPKPMSSMDFPVGKTDFKFRAIVTSSPRKTSAGPEIRVEFRTPASEFTTFHDQRDQIDAEFGGALEWDWEGKEGAMTRAIPVRQKVDWRDDRHHEGCFRWLVENLDKLHEVFLPRIQNL